LACERFAAGAGVAFHGGKLWPQVDFGEGFPPAKRPARDTLCYAARGLVQVSLRNARLDEVEGQLAGELQLVSEREYILLNSVVCHSFKEDSRRAIDCVHDGVDDERLGLALRKRPYVQ
jgi:hypothetical protein